MIRAAIALVAVGALLASCAGPPVDDASQTPGPSVAGDAGFSPSTAVAPEATPASTPSADTQGAAVTDQPGGRGPSPSRTAEQRAVATPARSGPSPTARLEKTPPTRSAAPTPGASFAAAPIEAGGPGQVTGVLGFDTVEGGCLYVETAAGTRFELLLPTTWRMDTATRRIVGPAGAHVSVGERVSVTGAVTDVIATICQVGPVFRVTGIVPVH